MRNRSRRPLVALVAVLVAAFALSSCKFDGAYDLPLPGGRAVDPDDAITVTAEFADALNVVPRTAVMVDDVPIGQVSEIERVGWHAKVTLQIRKDLNLPANTYADIRQTSLLGEKYVALLPPETNATGTLAQGDNIGLDRTGRNPEVEEVLGALSFVLSGGGVQQIRTISVEINKMLNGRTDQARGALTGVTRLVSTLDQQKTSILNALDAVNDLARTLNKEGTAVGQAIDAMGPALRVLNGQHRNLVTMLRELDKLSVVGTRVLRASKDDLIATLQHLGPALRELADAGDSLPRGVSLLASFPFPKEAANLAKGDYANAMFSLDFDLSKLLSGGGAGDTSYIPNPIELCMATPAKPLCKALDETVLKQLCKLLPTSPLCPASGPGAHSNPNNPLGTLLGGLLGGSKKPAATGTGGLLGSLSTLLGGGKP